MDIMGPSHEFIDDVVGAEILRKLEWCGRTAYKSESKMGPALSGSFIRSLIDRGHESVIEHVCVTVKLICDRGVTHELVRHRLVSYTQESTRYCNYSKLGITYIMPPWGLDDEDHRILKLLEDHYNKKISEGQSPQMARYFLPNGLKTEIIVTANLREWRHILKLRTARDAHPQMRQLMLSLLDDFRRRIPVVFDDIAFVEVEP